MARLRKMLPFRELTLPWKMLKGRLANRKRNITPFTAREVEHGRLQLVDGVPLLHVRGTPREMGRALGELFGVQACEIHEYYMRYFMPDAQGDLKLAREMEPRFPDWFREEMEGFTETSGMDADKLLLGQTFLDIHKVAFCSTIAAHGRATVGGEMLMGRNLDFPSLDIAHEANCVVVYAPEAGRAYAGVTWPGFLGILSGMNADGLALSMMLVYGHSRREHLRGQPFPLVFRRLLHECADLPEAAKLLDARPYCTTTNLIACDKNRRAARWQLHPQRPHVDFTGEEEPATTCTNHFLEPGIRRFAFTWFSSVLRLRRLRKTLRQDEPLDVEAIKVALQRTCIPAVNMQRIIFRPESLELEVAFEDLGRGPGRWVRISADLLFPAREPIPESIV